MAGAERAGFNELAWEGAKRAADVFGAELKEVTAGRTTPMPTGRRVSRSWPTPATTRSSSIGSTYAGPVAKVAPKYPRIWFGILDDGTVNAPNVIGIQFNEEQGSFLVGAAAALTSKTGNVGFIGAVQIPLLQKYEAGFTAGARAADPDVEVQVAYLSQPPDDSRLQRPGQGQEGRAGHVRRGRRRDLRGGRRFGQRGDPGRP